MTTKKLCNAVFMLYKYAIMTKRIHYSCKINHLHEMCDTIMDDIISFADEVAEGGFGLYGKPAVGDMTVKIKVDEQDTAEAICDDVIDIATQMREDLESDKKAAGLVSVIDDFLSKMSKNKFLLTMEG